MFSVFELPAEAEERRLLALLTRPAPEAAQALLGQVLLRRRRGRTLAARIVETEAYLPEGDPAAHVFRGPTPRNAPLYGPSGNVYVYFVYGMHHCLNLAADRQGRPGCVLIRAAELLPKTAPHACRGPGRLCRTLGLTARDSGANLFTPSTRLTLRAGPPPRNIGVTMRIGVRHAAERPLRFFDADSPAVSGPRRRPP